MSEPQRARSIGIACGLAGAVLFGASAPLAKHLVGQVTPQLLAGLLYLGAAAALGPVVALRPRAAEARLTRSDLPLLISVAGFGGVAAPVLMLLGLQRVSAVTGSLLLNLEVVLTMAVAVIWFGEHLPRRALAGSSVVVVAAALFAFEPGRVSVSLAGIGFLVAACACWAIDNNLTQRLSDRDPFHIVLFKTGAAATVNLTLAISLGAAWPMAGVILLALLLGATAYGMSIVLDAYALRMLGAAREAAFFASAPFFGVVVAVLVLGERLPAIAVVASVLMLAGSYLLVTESHGHEHRHQAIDHDHRHRHDDDHHEHHHPGQEAGAHAHPHHHEPLDHAHGHVSDSHHRHRHRG